MDLVETSWNITLYVPVHTGFSQIENVAPFITSNGTKTRLFFYDWNNFAPKLKQYFREHFPNCSQHPFSRAELARCASEDYVDDQRIVVLLTSSSNYAFGKAQRYFFTRVFKASLPETAVLDIYTVGHCMYGCESSSHGDYTHDPHHNVPLKFTRWFQKSLPYSAEEITKQFLSPILEKKQLPVLLAPSFGVTSLLQYPIIIERLVKLQSWDGELQFSFVAKLHSSCNSDKANPHPLDCIDDADHIGADIIQSRFQTVDERLHNILPFLEAFSVVIADANSSVPFECLRFPHLRVLVFAPHDYTVDPGIARHVSVFRDASELETLLTNCYLAILRGDENPLAPIPTGPSGKMFFEEKYTPVDGCEVLKIAEARNWLTDATFLSRMPANAEEVANDALLKMHLLEKTAYVNAPAASEWKEGELAHATVLDLLAIGEPVSPFAAFVTMHEQQLRQANVPTGLWEKLFHKLSSQTLDAGSAFQFAVEEDDPDTLELVAVDDMDAESDVFLVDHAWTFDTASTARAHLTQVEALRTRVASMLHLPEDAGVETILDNLWRLVECVHFGGSSRWCVMDEVGSSIPHSDESNFSLVPFVHLPSGASYSLLWPKVDVEQFDPITRDVFSGTEADPRARQLRLLGRGAGGGLPKALLDSALARRQERLSPRAPNLDFEVADSHTFDNEPVRVFSDAPPVVETLSHPQCQLAEDESVVRERGGIIWLCTDAGAARIEHARRESPVTMINQLPGEECLTMKHRLADTVHGVWGCRAWLPPTFNISRCVHELEEFVAEFTRRQRDGKSNHWVLKPWNAGRGVGVEFTNNLSYILRSIETGPKIVSAYVPQPLLLDGCKFDLRFVVYVCSSSPLRVYVGSRFWVRAAQHKFSMDSLDDQDIHNTVAHCEGPYRGREICSDEFVSVFPKILQESGCEATSWSDVLSKIHVMLWEVFAAGTCVEGGIASHPAARALYGVDVMLSGPCADPQLLEVNFHPDITRACRDDPGFVDKSFGLLFFNELPDGFATEVRSV